MSKRHLSSDAPAMNHGWVSREALSWMILLVVAALLRLWDLGARVMTHDESIHAYYSLTLLREGLYRHDPIYHGPLLYHLNAAVHLFLGVSEFGRGGRG